LSTHTSGGGHSSTIDLQNPVAAVRARAFDALFPELFESVVKYARKEGARRTSADAEDIAQQVLFGATRRITQAPITRQDLWNYLATSIRNKLADRTRRPHAGDELCSTNELAKVEQGAFGEREVPADMLHAALSAELMHLERAEEGNSQTARVQLRAVDDLALHELVAREALRQMKVQKADLELLRLLWCGKSYRECEAELGLPDGRARHRHFRMRERVRNHVGSMIREYEPTAQLDILRKLGFEEESLLPA
jgi:RNA polymerase sigma factor (sigma-70 family)